MRIKVCGMKYPENIKQVAALHPDYLGFIFWDPSPRSFSGTIPDLPENIRKVGVFVDAPVPIVVDKVIKHSLDLIQLHGKESAAYCDSLREELKKNSKSAEDSSRTEVEIVKAFAVGGTFDFESLESYGDIVNHFLFDSKGPLPGGNGFGFNWELLKDYPFETPFFLSGGIGLEALESLRKFLKTPVAEKCHAIDVNSAFEDKPGLKNVRSLELFINKIKL